MYDKTVIMEARDITFYLDPIPAKSGVKVQLSKFENGVKKRIKLCDSFGHAQDFIHENYGKTA